MKHIPMIFYLQLSKIDNAIPRD